MRRGQLERTPVAGFEQRRLTGPAVPPHRPDGMNHVPRRQPMASRQFRIPGRAAVERSAFGEQLGAGRAMDRTVHPAAAQQRFVRGIHDRVHGEGRDVRAERAQREGRIPGCHGAF